MGRGEVETEKSELLNAPWRRNSYRGQFVKFVLESDSLKRATMKPTWTAEIQYSMMRSITVSLLELFHQHLSRTMRRQFAVPLSTKPRSRWTPVKHVFVAWLMYEKEALICFVASYINFYCVCFQRFQDLCWVVSWSRCFIIRAFKYLNNRWHLLWRFYRKWNVFITD